MEDIQHSGINIKELKTTMIRHSLGAKYCSYRWHYKNKGNSNFGISILGVNGFDYELSGKYAKTGFVFGMRFGLIYEAGFPIWPIHFENMIEKIKYVIEDYEKRKSEKDVSVHTTRAIEAI